MTLMEKLEHRLGALIEEEQREKVRAARAIADREEIVTQMVREAFAGRVRRKKC